MYRSFLSWRYLFARRTNLIGITGIMVAVFALIVLLSVMSGFLEEGRRAVRGTLADLIILPDPLPRGRSTTRPEPMLPEPLLAEIRADERVQSTCAQILWGGMITQAGKLGARELSLAGGGNPLFVQFVGIDVSSTRRLCSPAWTLGLSAVGAILPAISLQDEFTTTAFLPALTGELRGPPSAPVASALFPFLPPPGYAPEGRRRASVLVGDQLLSLLGLAVGDILEVGTIVQDEATGEYPINNRSFVVAGSFRTGDNQTDLGRLYFERSELSDLMGDTRRFTQILVKLKDFHSDAKTLRDELRQDLAPKGLLAPGRPSQVRTWEEFRVNILGAIENERTLMAIMLSLVLVVAGFTVFAILTMMISEKRREIGILLGLGATQRGVLDLFLMIALWDALLGTTLGTALGIWATLRINAIEETLSDWLGFAIINREVYLFDHIPTRIEPLGVLSIVAGAFICTIVFAAIPAWRAARLDPMDGIRYE